MGNDNKPTPQNTECECGVVLSLSTRSLLVKFHEIADEIADRSDAVFVVPVLGCGSKSQGFKSTDFLKGMVECRDSSNGQTQMMLEPSLVRDVDKELKSILIFLVFAIVDFDIFVKNRGLSLCLIFEF